MKELPENHTLKIPLNTSNLFGAESISRLWSERNESSDSQCQDFGNIFLFIRYGTCPGKSTIPCISDKTTLVESVHVPVDVIQIDFINYVK